MQDAIVTLSAGQLPQGFCFQNPQQYYEAIIAATSAVLPGIYSTFNFGNATPAPEDQDKPWIRTDAFGRMDRVYTYAGVWMSPNPRPPSDSERMIWVGTEAELWSYDGGDGTDPGAFPPTATSGAMWQRDTAFNDRFPLGVGSNLVGTTGGAATETHHHSIPIVGTFTGGVTPVAISPVTDDTVIDIMPPWLAVFFAARTARKFYTV